VSTIPFSFRPATASDYLWLWELKRLTMRPYVEQTWGSWDEATQEEFFRRNFSSETVQIVLVGGQNAGLLNIEREPAELFLANVQIHPEFQNRGLGSAVIETVLSSAQSLGVSVRLQVLRVNVNAAKLYARMGFVTFKETPTHLIMRWQPSREPSSPGNQRHIPSSSRRAFGHTPVD
jgi:ribosomal protein S18 acetylase RimI-like enzyme